MYLGRHKEKKCIVLRMKRYTPRVIRKRRNAIGAKRKRGVRRRKLGVSHYQYKRAREAVGVAATGIAAYRGVMRPAGAPRGVPKRQRRNVATFNGDMTSAQRLWKRRRFSVKPLLRGLMKMQEYCLYRFQGVKRMNASNDGTTQPGYYALLAQDPVTLSNPAVPLHLFDLTCTRVPLSAPAVGYQMAIDNTGAVTFSSMSGQVPAGTDAANCPWQLERTSAQSLDLTTRYIKTDWIDIRLNLYGCNQVPTYFDIMLVQLKDDFCDPLTVPSTNEQLTRRNLFWQGMVKSLTYNPLLPGDNSWYNGVRILRRYRKKFDPSEPFSSAEVLDKNPDNHVVKVFYADNKIRNHQWQAAAALTDTAAMTQQWRSYTASATELLPTVHPKAKLFLVVRALNTTPETSGNALDTPTYDIVIRKKVTYVP